MVLSPRWAGAKQPVMVDIDVQSASVEARTGVELPNQTRSQTVTSISAPLGEWITVATDGQQPKVGVYSSAAASDAVRLLQIRITTH
jgi:hypothetical protein